VRYRVLITREYEVEAQSPEQAVGTANNQTPYSFGTNMRTVAVQLYAAEGCR
jgi:hypothetical protein